MSLAQTAKEETHTLLTGGGRPSTVMSLSFSDPFTPLSPLKCLQKAKDEGCTLLTGGGRVRGKVKGFWVQPTVFMATPKDTIWQEEVLHLGPIE